MHAYTLLYLVYAACGNLTAVTAGRRSDSHSLLPGCGRSVSLGPTGPSQSEERQDQLVRSLERAVTQQLETARTISPVSRLCAAGGARSIT
jgi:hypothetical protein